METNDWDRVGGECERECESEYMRVGESGCVSGCEWMEQSFLLLTNKPPE